MALCAKCMLNGQTVSIAEPSVTGWMKLDHRDLLSHETHKVALSKPLLVSNNPSHKVVRIKQNCPVHTIPDFWEKRGELQKKEESIPY